MSTIRAATVSDQVGTGPATLTGQNAPKAYAAGSLETLQQGFNITSVTDGGVGIFGSTFTNTLGSSGYPYGTASRGSSGDRFVGTGNNTTTGVSAYCYDGSTLTDMSWGFIAAGELA